MKRVVAMAVASLVLAAAAPDPADRLPDADQEARARALFSGVRCVVCQNESIDDSEADLAHDLRQTIRGQVSAGKSDEEIRRFLVARYGDFILLRPRVSWGNSVLWGAPFAILLIGAALLLLRRPGETREDPLSNEEIEALEHLKKQPDNKGLS